MALDALLDPVDLLNPIQSPARIPHGDIEKNGGTADSFLTPTLCGGGHLNLTYASPKSWHLNL